MLLEDAYQRFREYAERNSLVIPGEKVLLGVSCGKDSMFGAELMSRWAREVGFTLEAFISLVPPLLYEDNPVYAATLAHIRALGITVHQLRGTGNESRWTDEIACDECKAQRTSNGNVLASLSAGSVVGGCFTFDDLLHYCYSLLYVTGFQRAEPTECQTVRHQFGRRLMRFIPRAARADGGHTIYPCLPFRSREIQRCLDESATPYLATPCRFSAKQGCTVRIQCREPEVKHAFAHALEREYGHLSSVRNCDYEALRDFAWDWIAFTPNQVEPWPG